MAKRTKGRYGDGSVFQRSDGLYVARLELDADAKGNRRRWQATSRTVEGAMAKLAQARIDRATTGTVPAKIAAGDWMDRWLATIVAPRRKPRVTELYTGTVEKWLRPALGKRPLARITAGEVYALVAKVEAETSSGNAARVLRVLRSCLSAAVRHEVIPRNVAALVETPTSATRRTALTADQARVLVHHLAARPDRSRWLMALLTGARQAECLGLQWDRVDLKAGLLDISVQLQQLPAEHGCLDSAGDPTCGRARVSYCPQVRPVVPPGFAHERLGGGTFALIAPKSEAGRRVIPIPPLLTDALREHRAATGLGAPHNLCWTSARGRPISRRVDSMAWDGLLRQAGLPDVPLHSARHTTATLLMELGVDRTIVKAIMGHSDALTTAAYQHADTTMARRALDGLGAALG